MQHKPGSRLKYSRGIQLGFKSPKAQALGPGGATRNTDEIQGSSRHPESTKHQQGTQTRFSTQSSRGQAVSTSKHGFVCAKGCCHSPKRARRGHIRTGPQEGGKQEPLSGRHGAVLVLQEPSRARAGGSNPKNPIGGRLPPHRPAVCSSVTAKQGASQEFFTAPVGPEAKIIPRGLKEFGDNSRGTQLVPESPAASPTAPDKFLARVSGGFLNSSRKLFHQLEGKLEGSAKVKHHGSEAPLRAPGRISVTKPRVLVFVGSLVPAARCCQGEMPQSTRLPPQPPPALRAAEPLRCQPGPPGLTAQQIPHGFFCRAGSLCADTQKSTHHTSTNRSKESYCN